MDNRLACVGSTVQCKFPQGRSNARQITTRETMMRSKVCAAAIVIFIAVGFPAFAEDADSMVLLPSDAAVKWQPGPPNLPKGTQIAVLIGDPGKPGPFVLRVKFPAHTIVAPHTHATAENLTVISGDLYHQMGEKLDQSRGNIMHTGGFTYLPADMPHSVWTTDDGSVVQVTGTGPFGLNYVNPADDPSKKS
jgi:quercetin dioxygenase-like cupin family protein